jgi:hypothetical protein
MTSSNRFARLTLFASAYFVQGAVLTYFSTFNVLYLRSFDLSYSRIGIVGGITLVPFINPAAQFPLFVLLSSLAALGMSTYDTCTDGFSIDVTPREQRGLAQGVMVGGRAMGAIAIDEGELARMHGVDERISLENLELGTRVVYETLRATCGQ